MAGGLIGALLVIRFWVNDIRVAQEDLKEMQAVVIGQKSQIDKTEKLRNDMSQKIEGCIIEINKLKKRKK